MKNLYWNAKFPLRLKVLRGTIDAKLKNLEESNPVSREYVTILWGPAEIVLWKPQMFAG